MLISENNPILREHSSECSPFEESEFVEMICGSLRRTCNEHKGIGLAANQIGFTKRIIFIKPKFTTGFCLINPVIMWKSPVKIKEEESCLSLPSLSREVFRHYAVTVQYFNESLEKKEKTFTNMAARIVQHEIDHLDGILIKDYINGVLEPRVSI